MEAEIVDAREIYTDSRLDELVKTGTVEAHAKVLDIRDYERALIRVDGHFRKILEPGLYILWNRMGETDVA